MKTHILNDDFLDIANHIFKVSRRNIVEAVVDKDGFVRCSNPDRRSLATVMDPRLIIGVFDKRSSMLDIQDAVIAQQEEMGVKAV